jgi:hypothetical protein
LRSGLFESSERRFEGRTAFRKRGTASSKRRGPLPIKTSRSRMRERPSRFAARRLPGKRRVTKLEGPLGNKKVDLGSKRESIEQEGRRSILGGRFSLRKSREVFQKGRCRSHSATTHGKGRSSRKKDVHRANSALIEQEGRATIQSVSRQPRRLHRCRSFRRRRTSCRAPR